MTLLHKITIYFGCFFISLCSIAQSHQYKANLNKVNKTAFYKITIDPTLSSYLKADFSDIRVVAKNNEMVPFIIKNATAPFNNAYYKQLGIIQNSVDDSGHTIIIINNIYKSDTNSINNFNNLLFIIKNSQVNRCASISGSNDATNWYIIKDDALLTNNFTLTSKTNFASIVYFNNNDYKFFKININNQHSDPLNVEQVGVYEAVDNNNNIQYNAAHTINFTQADSANGNSYVEIMNSIPTHVDVLNFEISSPKYYKRTVSIYLPNTITGKYNLQQPYLSFIVNAAIKNTVALHGIFTKKLLLVINNNDNPPLVIKNIYSAQIQTNIFVYLNANEPYYLLLKDSLATTPHFDLENFTDSIPTAVDTVSYSNITPIPAITTTVTQNINWVWPTIIIAIIALGFLSFTLLKDIKKQH